MILVSILRCSLNHYSILIDSESVVRPKRVIKSKWPFSTRARLDDNRLRPILKVWVMRKIFTILMQHLDPYSRSLKGRTRTATLTLILNYNYNASWNQAA